MAAVPRTRPIQPTIQQYTAKSCCIGQYSARALSRAHCIAIQLYTAIQRNAAYSHASLYSLQHSTPPLCMSYVVGRAPLRSDDARRVLRVSDDAGAAAVHFRRWCRILYQFFRGVVVVSVPVAGSVEFNLERSTQPNDICRTRKPCTPWVSRAQRQGRRKSHDERSEWEARRARRRTIRQRRPRRARIRSCRPRFALTRRLSTGVCRARPHS